MVAVGRGGEKVFNSRRGMSKGVCRKEGAGKGGLEGKKRGGGGREVGEVL
jgi:hypothetical protein